ncbi:MULTISPECIES: hypothetical protein [unclassified Diaminobutyricimonas]|uniref:hypothetical protein n=1 Tax=unclassified Diaminobutyricimonas TaxID=2643261 RepID=UPI0012F51744|nr:MULTISPECIES: hypothetical protein [unclassified Diaminobutyricimonas]
MVIFPEKRSSKSTADLSLISDDTWAVLSENDTLGFVVRAGEIYVALSGSDLHHAVEISQKHRFDEAVASVRRH